MKFNCKHCKGEYYTLQLRAYKNHMKKTQIDPKWLPHIVAWCNSCGKCNGAIQQTEDLRQEIDGQALSMYDFKAVQPALVNLENNY